MAELNTSGKKMKVLLKTMGQEKPVPSYKISGMKVAALKEPNTFLKLPDVFTQESIPVNKDNIPTEEDIRKWPYLKDIELTPIKRGYFVTDWCKCSKSLGAMEGY